MTDQEFSDALAKISARRNETERKELRDRFAMAVLTGICAAVGDLPNIPEHVATTCFRVADAMLEAREK